EPAVATQTFEVEHFARAHPGEQFPAFTALSAAEARRLVRPAPRPPGRAPRPRRRRDGLPPPAGLVPPRPASAAPGPTANALPAHHDTRPPAPTAVTAHSALQPRAPTAHPVTAVAPPERKPATRGHPRPPASRASQIPPSAYR